MFVVVVVGVLGVGVSGVVVVMFRAFSTNARRTQLRKNGKC